MTATRTDASHARHELAEFEAVYRAHFPFVWRSLRRLGVPERDLPDSAHDVFLVVHARLGEFDFKHRLTTWLYAIAIRVASQRRRRAATRNEVLGEEHEPRAEEESAPFVAQRALLDRCLDALPIEQRAVFTLFELEGMTGQEIAALLDIPAPTVHSRLRLARETFRLVLKRAKAHDEFELFRTGAKP